MKENGKLTEKIVKGLIIAGGTLIGMAVSACVKSKDDPIIETGSGEMEVDYTVTDEAVSEEVIED